jgi:hypothetical protein
MRLTPRVAGFRSEYPAGFKLESLGLSWVALEDARHRHERDAAQAGLNEAAGRELKRLWGLRAPQTCAIRDQLGWVNGQISAQPGRRDRFGAQ